MRRFWLLCMLFPLLALPARARETQRYTALVIDSGGNPKYTGLLLDGLYDRGLQATFLLQGRTLAQTPELLRRILEDGHEVGCRGFTGENMTFMSRRAIASEIMDFEALLPPSYPLRLFCPPGGLSDGVRQVAQARRLAILSWSADISFPIEEIPEGCLILLRDTNRLMVEESLAYVDKLLEGQFRPITVSQLAKQHSIRLQPGQSYSSFPPQREKTAD